MRVTPMRSSVTAALGRRFAFVGSPSRPVRRFECESSALALHILGIADSPIPAALPSRAIEKQGPRHPEGGERSNRIRFRMNPGRFVGLAVSGLEGGLRVVVYLERIFRPVLPAAENLWW